MNNLLKNFMIFSLGAAVGAGITYAVTKKYYEDISEKEIESAKQAYINMQKNLFEKNKLEKERIMDDYKKGLASFGYVNEVLGPNNEPPAEEIIEDNLNADEEESEEEHLDKHVEIELPKEPIKNDIEQDVYLITSEILGEDGYEMEDVTFYSDGIITDSYDNVIPDTKQIFGETMLDLFAQYDSEGFTETFVRNDILKKDYVVDFAGYDFQEA